MNQIEKLAHTLLRIVKKFVRTYQGQNKPLGGMLDSFKLYIFPICLSCVYKHTYNDLGQENWKIEACK
jgi:hypothetical protein